MSNPYSQEILSSVSTRIGAERLIVADQWIRDCLVEFASDGVGSSAQNLVGSPAEHRWMAEPGTVLDGVRRLMDGSAESVNMLQMPARWLLRGLFWSLSTDLPGEWLVGSVITYDAYDYPRIAEALFGENSVSLSILLDHLRATDPTRDRLALLGGAMWSLSMLTVWTGVILSHLDDREAIRTQPVPRDLAVEMFADLRADLLGDSRFESFRDLARRRQERGRDGQVGVAPEGEDGGQEGEEE